MNEAKFLETFHKSLYLRPDGDSLQKWVARVRRVQVDVRPGGRALLRMSDAGPEVEIRFHRGTSGYFIDEYHVFAGVEIEVGAYFAALLLELERTGRQRKRGSSSKRERAPHAGRPPATGFYRTLLAEYERFVAAGERAPVKRLAKKHDAPDGTVKSWLSRARKLREQEKGEA